MNSPEIYLGGNRMKLDVGGQDCYMKDAYNSTEILARFILGIHLQDFVRCPQTHYMLLFTVPL